MSDVREPGAFGLETVDESQSLLDGLVHGMWNVAQGIDDEIVKAFEEGGGGVQQRIEIGEVGGAAKAIAEDADVAVAEWHRNKCDPEQLERFVYDLEFHAGNGAKSRTLIEDIRKGAPKDGQGFFGAVDGQRG